jgi:hypothetical protein
MLSSHHNRMLNGMLIVRGFALILSFALLLTTASARAENAPPVVVELFTSQGCSSCPPADTYLGELAQRPDVLALAFHVDYWNYIGWTDPFAMKLATQRQHDYADRMGLRYVYTPQMIIDGTTEGVGSERATIATLIKAAAGKQTHIPTMLSREADGRLSIHIDAGTTPEPATIWLVGFDGVHATRVLHGENEGRTLRDYQVVRSFRQVGTWRGPAVDLAVAADEVAGDGGVAVLVQRGGNGAILGAACLKPPTS